MGEVWSYQQLAHSKAEVFFKCHLFRKSAMDQRLILSALTSAALQHASATGDPGTYTGAFDKIPANSQVSNYSSFALKVHKIGESMGYMGISVRRLCMSIQLTIESVGEDIIMLWHHLFMLVS